MHMGNFVSFERTCWKNFKITNREKKRWRGNDLRLFIILYSSIQSNIYFFFTFFQLLTFFSLEEFFYNKVSYEIVILCIPKREIWIVSNIRIKLFKKSLQENDFLINFINPSFHYFFSFSYIMVPLNYFFSKTYYRIYYYDAFKNSNQ